MVVVTGAAGFIGSHTCERLLATGSSVVGIDNFRTGRRENLTGAEVHPDFVFVEADVTDRKAMARVFAYFGPTAIVHLAGLVSVQESFANPALNVRLNIEATQGIAELAREFKIPRVVFASSAAVYGAASAIPLGEEMSTRPMSPYGAAKLASEALLLSHAPSSGFTASCLRYFNVYGPRQDPHSSYSGVISIFAERMRAGVAPTIFGDGQQSRDFISVYDVARANVIAATAPHLRSGKANICTGHATTINELVSRLSQLLPGALPPTRVPAKAGDIRFSCGRPDRAKQEMGFTAAFSLERGLADWLQREDACVPAVADVTRP